MTLIAPYIKSFFLNGLNKQGANCRAFHVIILAVGVILSGCSTVQQQAQNGVAVVHPSVPVVSSLIPQVQTRISKSSVAPTVWPTNTIMGDGIVGFMVWNGHVVPYVKNTGAGNFHTDECPPYGSWIISDVLDVYYSRRVTVFDSEDPNGIGHNYTYTLWESPDLNSHCWIQLDSRCSYGPIIELFDTPNRPGFYRITRE